MTQHNTTQRLAWGVMRGGKGVGLAPCAWEKCEAT